MICNNLGVNEKGHLTFAGHDTVELAQKYQTPAYIMDENKNKSNPKQPGIKKVSAPPINGDKQKAAAKASPEKKEVKASSCLCIKNACKGSCGA